MNAEALRQRLLDPAPGGLVDRLAGLVLEDVYAAKVREVLPPEVVAAWARDALAGWAASDAAPAALERLVEHAANALHDDGRKVGELVPAELRRAVLEVAARPFSPERRLVLSLLDRRPMRERLRELVVAVVSDYAARTPGAGMAKGLGGLAKFAADQARARTGGLGALVGAVTDEVSGQVERRSKEFADLALAGVLQQLADIISSPRRAAEAAELRVSFLEGVLDLTLPQLARELVNLDVPGGAQVLRDGVRAWLGTPAAARTLADAAARLLAPVADQPVGTLAQEWGARAALDAHLRPLLAARLARLFAQDGFLGWLEALLGAQDGA